MAAPEAPPATTAAPDAKSLYMPLQNGSDVRGVAVEGERHLLDIFGTCLGTLQRCLQERPGNEMEPRTRMTSAFLPPDCAPWQMQHIFAIVACFSPHNRELLGNAV